MIKLTGLIKRYPGRAVTANAVDGLNLEIPEGKLVTLLGPSGCGKTTTLRLIAGLERADSGVIEIGDQVVSDSSRNLFLGAHRRPIGMVFQSYAIWPHMTVVENVMFPLRVSQPRGGQPKMKRAEAREKALAALDLVGLADFADRSATALSGGQQQRVALARALVREPRVLLLDEPLSNLDAGLRDRMRDEIREVQQRLGITTIFVTHDQDEALAVSDNVVLMNKGNIVEQGLPYEIYAWPRSPFTARFLGASNHLTGTVTRLDKDTVDVEVPFGSLCCRPCPDIATGDEVSVFLRPESFRLSRKRRTEHDWEGQVEFSIFHGDCWDYHVRLGDQTLKIRAYQEKLGIAHGDTVFVQPDEQTVIILPLEEAAATATVPAPAKPAKPSASAAPDASTTSDASTPAASAAAPASDAANS